MRNAPMAATVPDGFELVPCPGCNASEGSSAYVSRQGFRIVRCSVCELAYLNPRPTEQHLLSYYPETYPPYQSQRGEVERRLKFCTNARLLVMRNAYGRADLRPRGASKILARLMSLIKSPQSCGEAIAHFAGGRFLDFGCGSGTFLRRMRAMGWRGVGIDFTDAPVQRVRDSGIEAYVGTLPSRDLHSESFDLITMRHSLEHVARPREVLEAARELLSPGGVIEIRVPNFAGGEIERFGDASNMLDLPRHLIHFDAQSLGALLRQSGFDDVVIEQKSRAGSLRKSARAFGKNGFVAAAMARSTLLCKWMARRYERQGRGNELIATARRPAKVTRVKAHDRVLADALV
jgi:2-polyprenyl-3-methyl-5-hydroxy-6-metoxy-1,4-benzoquinol methylase